MREKEQEVKGLVHDSTHHQVNVSFIAACLKILRIPNGHLPGSDAQNDAFRSNQQSDAINNLEDPVDAQTNSLLPVMITAPEDQLLNSKLNEHEHHLRPLTEFGFVKRGNVRPESEAGHDYFGYLDGISQPKKRQSKGFDDNQGGEKVGVIGSVVILMAPLLSLENSSIGRWKSGVPVVIADEKDDPSLAKSQEARIP
ncbi:hypothetical protein BY996DRAFT_6421173 [Phakopsora pachyrhizi]|nr:hypothetical protein BY996DRAFT_6421173 [Phakopsora pachyrhizi]